MQIYVERGVDQAMKQKGWDKAENTHRWGKDQCTAGPVWPDDGIKSCPIFPNIAQ